MRRLGESIGKIAGGILGYTVVNAFLLFFTYCFISLFAQIGPIDIKLGVIAVTILSYIFLPAANIIINIIFKSSDEVLWYSHIENRHLPARIAGIHGAMCLPLLL